MTTGRTVVDSPQPAKVLIVIQNLPLEFDRRVRLECDALVAAGHQVSVICPKVDPDQDSTFELDGVSVYAYRPVVSGGGVYGYFCEFVLSWLMTAVLSVKVRRRSKFSVLQACNPPDTYWFLAWLWKRFATVDFVYDQHDLCPEIFTARFGRKGVVHRLLLWLEKMSYRTADRVISPNRSYRDVALTRGGVDESAISVVMSCPVVPELSIPSLRRPETTHRVCYLGVMGPQDGVDRFVDAAAHYVHRLGRRDATFVLMGFGDCLTALQERVARLELDDFVEFTGRVDSAQIARILSGASVGVVPDPVNEFNDKSTMNKLLEYMAYEVAVVATELTETRYVAGDLALYAGDPVDMAVKIAWLHDHAPERSRRAREGRRRIENGLNWGVFEGVYVRAATGLAVPTSTPDLLGPVVELSHSTTDVRA